MFEDLAKKLQGLGLSAIKKTGDVAEIASLKAKVIAKKKNIQDSYAELGKAFYEAHKADPDELSDQLKGISALYSEVEKFENEIKALKEKLQEEMKKEAETAKETAEEAADEAAEAVQETIDDVVEAMDQISGEIAEAMEEVSEDVAEELTKAMEEISEEVSEGTSEEVEKVE